MLELETVPRILGLAACVLLAPISTAGADSAPTYENLEVLPKDISEDALLDAMLENLHGLGLPRLAGEGCLYCHVGDLERPRREWDYASDAKPMKHKARAMMAMVEAINRDHLGKLKARIAPGLRVSCATCHAGRTDPRPMPDVLADAYTHGGVAAAKARYKALHAAYFGADAYDFRPPVLGTFAVGLADRGALDDAVALAAFGVEMSPGHATAEQTWVRLLLERAIEQQTADGDAEAGDARDGGAAAAIAALDRLAPTLASGVLTPGLLDGLGWRLYRSDRRAAAIALFEHNRERFPGDYLPQESVAFALDDAGDRPAALTVLEAWLERHPNHERARNLLLNMQASR